MTRELTAEEALEDVRNALGKELCTLLDSPGWSDIMINDDGSVWVDTTEMYRVNCKTTNEGLASAAFTLASYAHKTFNNTDGQSLVAIVPKMNLRAIFLNKPFTERVSAVFRKPSGKLLMPEDMINSETITANQMDKVKEGIKEHKNIVISGGTGSGKTTIMNTFLTLVDHSERLVLIEDTPELIVTQPNVLKMTVNYQHSYMNAIADALRCRPTRIIIGECREGDQTMQMLKAWNTGHPGGMTTIHANSCEEVLSRMDQLCGEVSVSSQMAMIKGSVDMILQMKRLDGSRRKVVDMYDLRKEEHVE